LVPAFDEGRNQGPAIAVFRVQLNQELLLFLAPLFFAYSVFEVIVVALTALFASSSIDVILLTHYFSNLTPILDAFNLIYFFQDVIFLHNTNQYLLLPYFTLAHY
jgi:hypothetical protein